MFVNEISTKNIALQTCYKSFYLLFSSIIVAFKYTKTLSGNHPHKLSKIQNISGLKGPITFGTPVFENVEPSVFKISEFLRILMGTSKNNNKWDI